MVALEPAVADAEAEKEVLAAAPLAPEEALAWMYILFSLAGSFGEVGLRFQDHVVLVELGVHGVDLALAEGVVEGVVYGRGGDAQPRSGDPVNGQRYRQAAGLLIGGHVFQLRQLLQLVDKPVGPKIQLVYVRIFQRVLVLGPAHPVIDRDVLHRLHEQLDAAHLAPGWS